MPDVKTSRLVLKNRLVLNVTKLIDQIACEHSWESLGHGYKCPRCNFYTGGDSELNGLITNELEREKK